jgi:hypothetical protein
MATVPAADANEVMREQLDYLIEHATSDCGCGLCQRYRKVREILLEVFGYQR